MASRPENIQIMSSALLQAWQRLPANVDRNDDVRRHLAAIILERFLLGVRDPERLCGLALVEIARSTPWSIAFDELS